MVDDSWSDMVSLTKFAELERRVATNSRRLGRLEGVVRELSIESTRSVVRIAPLRKTRTSAKEFTEIIRVNQDALLEHKNIFKITMGPRIAYLHLRAMISLKTAVGEIQRFLTQQRIPAETAPPCTPWENAY